MRTAVPERILQENSISLAMRKATSHSARPGLRTCGPIILVGKGCAKLETREFWGWIGGGERLFL